MDSIQELEQWYLSQCNDDWEHTYGIEIGTLDNPGWELRVDLSDTDLEDKDFQEYSYGVGDEAGNSGDDWLVTKLEEGKFVGFGGPKKLGEIIKIFLGWAHSDA